MAILPNDNLARIIGNEAYSSRIESFAWISLTQKDPSLTNIKTTPSSLRDFLANHLHQDWALANEIRHDLQFNIIPEHYLNWITDNHRQSRWIQTYITAYIAQSRSAWTPNTSQAVPPPTPAAFQAGIPHHLLRRELSIAIFDYLTSKAFTKMEEAIEYCKRMQHDWQSHTRQDQHLAWLDDADAEKKRDFFWGWLKSRDYHLTHGQSQFLSHEDLLIFFDQTRFSATAKEVFGKEAKRTWSQKQRREKTKDKKQCNFVLSEKTVLKLEMLAHRHGLSRTEIIELLVESEAKHERYISERLERKALLTTPLE